MVLGTVLLCEVKEMLEIEYLVTEKKGIISLAYGGYPYTIQSSASYQTHYWLPLFFEKFRGIFAFSDLLKLTQTTITE